MHDVAVEARQDPLSPFMRSSKSARHRHQVAGAAWCAVEPADQFLPPRLGKQKCRSLASASLGCARQVLDRLRKSLPDPGRNCRARFAKNERRPVVVELMVAIEHFARPSRCRKPRHGLIATHHIVRSGRMGRACRPMAPRGEARCGHARKIEARKIGEEGVVVPGGHVEIPRWPRNDVMDLRRRRS